jgi:hypothetical protein
MNCDAYELDSQQPDGADDPATFAWYLPRPLTAEQLARSIQLGLRGHLEDNHPLVSQLRKNIPAVMPENMVTSVNEPLFLTNSPVFNQFISESHESNHLLSQLAQLSSSIAAAEQLSLVLFGRNLKADEAVETLSFLRASDSSADEASPPSPERLEHVAWAWITSAEFRFNH